MIVGTEWLIEATGCEARCLRDIDTLQTIFAQVIKDLELNVVGTPVWHKFPTPGEGITGLALLTESHLACHTYPELMAATFNLYCCRERPQWTWHESLQNMLDAKNVKLQKIERGINFREIYGPDRRGRK